MTFDEATPYIYKICYGWERSYPRRFVADELFNEVWLAFEGDMSRFGNDYRTMGMAANRRIIEYVKIKDGRPGTYRYRGLRRTDGRLWLKKDDPVHFDGFDAIDNRDEEQHLLACLSPEDKLLFEMYYRQGMKQADIGKTFGIDRSAVSYRHRRALHEIRCKNHVA